jgi:hypothetical protein
MNRMKKEFEQKETKGAKEAIYPRKNAKGHERNKEKKISRRDAGTQRKNRA